MVAGECKFVLFFPFFFFHCNLNFLSIQLKLYVPPTPLLFFLSENGKKKMKRKRKLVVCCSSSVARSLARSLLFASFPLSLSLSCRGLITKDQRRGKKRKSLLFSHDRSCFHLSASKKKVDLPGTKSHISQIDFFSLHEKPNQ